MVVKRTSDPHEEAKPRASDPNPAEVRSVARVVPDRDEDIFPRPDMPDP